MYPKLKKIHVQEKNQHYVNFFSLIELQLSLFILSATSESCPNTTTPSKLQKNTVVETINALFKLEVLMCEIGLQIDTKKHHYDLMIKPTLLFGCEVWGYENIEQI